MPALGGVQDLQAVKESLTAQLRIPAAEPAVTEEAVAEPAKAEDLSPAADIAPQAALAFEEEQVNIQLQ